jgi:hypothetical protein
MQMDNKPKILVVGPVPPPYHGGAVVTENLLSSRVSRQQFELMHLDTSDRRDYLIDYLI